jgi:hypothetical protein
MLVLAYRNIEVLEVVFTEENKKRFILSVLKIVKFY